MENYDAIVIGSGQGGNPLARRLSAIGWKVAVVERRHIGGTCINTGCTPTKAMIASAKAAHRAGRLKEYGITAGRPAVDLRSVIARKDRMVTEFRDGAESALIAAGVEIIAGEARFLGPEAIRVNLTGGGSQELSATHFFLNTGARAAVPEIPGIRESGYHTSTSIMEIESVPAHLLIIGGGYIALEMGQMFRRFGSEVTILTRGDRILSREDPDIALEMQTLLEDEGIRFHFNAAITRLEKRPDGSIGLHAATGPEQQVISGSHVLLAAGRTPNTGDLGLDLAGVEADSRGYLIVDQHLRTSNSRIFAIGDVKGGPAFTHVSYNDYLVVYRYLVEGTGPGITDRMVPYCIFTDPEFARAGLNEEEARQKGLNFRVASLPMSSVARAIETGETRGFMKAIIDADTRQILGVGIIGPQAGELMSVLQIAMLGKITYDQLRDHMFAHPTLSEAINNLFIRLDRQDDKRRNAG
ncbi:MAG TPA: mercuric reductase [Sphingobacteriaceae bacterium]